LNAAEIGLVMRIGQQTDNFHLTDTLVHEMACGLPILAARLQGISEVVREDECGLLFHPDDMSEFKTKLKRLAGDEVLRARLGRRAHEIAREQFDVRQAAQAIAEPQLALAHRRTEAD
jgi:glycosyltransferase involved in cell wall biosynthesis